MKIPIYVYGLMDPRDGKIKYVGQSMGPDERLSQHIYKARKSRIRRRSALHRWIRKLLKENALPQVVILEAVRNPGSLAERKWIGEWPKWWPYRRPWLMSYATYRKQSGHAAERKVR